MMGGLDEMFGLDEMQQFLEKYQIAELDPEGRLCPGDSIHIAWFDDDDIRTERFTIDEISPLTSDYRLCDSDQLLADDNYVWLSDGPILWSIAHSDKPQVDAIAREEPALGAGQTQSGLCWAVASTLLLISDDPAASMDTVVRKLSGMDNSAYAQALDLPASTIESRVDELLDLLATIESSNNMMGA